MNQGRVDDAGSGGAVDDLGREVSKLSGAAFAMAQVATERGDSTAHGADPPARCGVERCRLEIRYVIEGGNPTLISVCTHRLLDSAEEPA
jgi:hypothetical protein